MIVGLDLVGELHLDRIELFVDEAGDIAGMAGQGGAGDRLQADGAGHVEPGGGRAIEKAGVERDRDRLAGRRESDAGLQLIVEPLGHVVFEQELRVADRRRLGVGVGVDRPGAGGGIRRQRRR